MRRLVAGFLLNLMPCVLPVIPLKVLSIIQQSQTEAASGDRFKAVKLALVFSAGILLVFVGLAVLMSVFKILYGQQFQSNGFKLVMLVIIYGLSLSMFGMFEIVIPGRISNVAVVKEGYLGALAMGVLATLLATPCSAPLLGPVLAWSLSKDLAVTVAVFLVVGIGMSSPYVLLTAFPKLLHRVPKAGNWMIRLKQGLGFVMLGVSVYLIFLFPGHWHFALIVFCLLLAFGVWLGMVVVNFSSPAGKRRVARILALAVIAVGGWYVYSTAGAEVEDHGAEVSWQDQKQQALWAGKNVMVEFTADWCPNCKAVELAVLKRQAFVEKLEQTNTVLVIADWTHEDATITAELNRLGSKSIPFAAVFSAKDPEKPILLRDIYSLDSAMKALEKANATGTGD